MELKACHGRNSPCRDFIPVQAVSSSGAVFFSFFNINMLAGRSFQARGTVFDINRLISIELYCFLIEIIPNLLDNMTIYAIIGHLQQGGA